MSLNYHWGQDDDRCESKEIGLIVHALYDDYTYAEIANAVFIAPNEILYPVPRYLYNPPPHILEVVSKSARNKLTTVQPEYTGVDVQFDATRTFVNCMIKGGKARHNVKNDGRGDYLLEVDLTISDEYPRRAFASSPMMSGTLVEATKEVDLNKFVPNKAYKGKLRMVVFLEMVEELAAKGIEHFVAQQKLLMEAGRGCFTFVLCKVFETNEPDIFIVNSAPWHPVKQPVVLTLEQIGEVDIDEEEFLATRKAAKELEEKNERGMEIVRQMRQVDVEMLPPIPDAPLVCDAGYNASQLKAEEDNAFAQCSEHLNASKCLFDRSAVLMSNASVAQTQRAANEIAARAKALKDRAKFGIN